MPESTTVGSGSESTSASEPSGPEVALTLDGEEDPSAIGSHRTVQLRAEVWDADGDAQKVEFYYGDERLAELSTPPFEVSLALSSVDSGSRVFRAVATDATQLTGEDELDVSVNISGGNIEDVERGLFESALVPVFFYEVGGGVSVYDNRVYVSSISAESGGRLTALLPELEVQWQQEFVNGLRSPAQGLPNGMLAIGTLEGGNWVVRTLEAGTGDTSGSWILGVAPSSDGGFGPLIAPLSDGIYATTDTQTMRRYSFAGQDLGTVVDTQVGVISGVAVNPASDLAYVSFGDVFESKMESCATSSDFCALAVSPGGETEWITGLAKQHAGIHRIAPALDGGAFLAAAVPSDDAHGYILLRINENGVVVDTALDGSTGTGIGDDDDDSIVAIGSDGKGGVVVCGSYGAIVPDAGEENGTFVALFDSDLDKVWEVRDLLSDTGSSRALGCAASADSVFVYGIEELDIGEAGGEPAAVGQAWIARVSL
jgi:hypothetical protein